MGKKKEIIETLNEFFEQDFDKNEIDEELLSLTLRANEFYSKAIKKYLKTVAVIEFNIIKHIKENSSKFESRSDMNNFIVSAIGDLKNKKDRTKTEEIELRTLIRFRDDVLKGQGKEYDITKGFTYDYDGQDVDFKPINMGAKK